MQTVISRELQVQKGGIVPKSRFPILKSESVRTIRQIRDVLGEETFQELQLAGTLAVRAHILGSLPRTRQKLRVCDLHGELNSERITFVAPFGVPSGIKTTINNVEYEVAPLAMKDGGEAPLSTENKVSLEYKEIRFASAGLLGNVRIFSDRTRDRGLPIWNENPKIIEIGDLTVTCVDPSFLLASIFNPLSGAGNATEMSAKRLLSGTLLQGILGAREISLEDTIDLLKMGSKSAKEQAELSTMTIEQIRRAMGESTSNGKTSEALERTLTEEQYIRYVFTNYDWIVRQIPARLNGLAREINEGLSSLGKQSAEAISNLNALKAAFRSFVG